MGVGVEMVEAVARGPQGQWVAGDIPPGGIESAVAEITGQKQKMVGDGLRLSAPARDPLRGERVAKIHQPHRAAFAVCNQIASQTAEDSIRASRAQRATGCANKQRLAPREKRLTPLAVMLKGANGGGMQRNHALGTKLAPMNAQRALIHVEVTAVQAQRLAGPDAGGGQQSDQRLVSQRMQRRTANCELSRASHEESNLGRAVEMRAKTLKAGAEQIGVRNLRS